MNVTEGENGIGVIDCFGNSIMDHKYDSVQVKLTVTATNKTETISKICKALNCKADDIMEFGDDV